MTKPAFDVLTVGTSSFSESISVRNAELAEVLDSVPLGNWTCWGTLTIVSHDLQRARLPTAEAGIDSDLPQPGHSIRILLEPTRLDPAVLSECIVLSAMDSSLTVLLSAVANSVHDSNRSVGFLLSARMTTLENPFGIPLTTR